MGQAAFVEAKRLCGHLQSRPCIRTGWGLGEPQGGGIRKIVNIQRYMGRVVPGDGQTEPGGELKQKWKRLTKGGDTWGNGGSEKETWGWVTWNWKKYLFKQDVKASGVEDKELDFWFSWNVILPSGVMVACVMREGHMLRWLTELVCKSD